MIYFDFVFTNNEYGYFQNELYSLAFAPIFYTPHSLHPNVRMFILIFKYSFLVIITYNILTMLYDIL